MTHLITFLGTSSYGETTYFWLDANGEEQTWTTPYASVATRHCCGADTVTVLATAEAEAMQREKLEAALGRSDRQNWLRIPTGESEAALWEIYVTLEGCVSDGEHIALDVTHGYRILPMVAIMATAFLAASRNIVVDRILYGAYEARDQSYTPPRTPLFDLTPMFALLGWASAADLFVAQGDARRLADLLRETRPTYLEQRADPTLRRRGVETSNLANSLTEVSANLLLNRPQSAMVAAERLAGRLSESASLSPRARPLAGLLSRVEDTFRWLALAEPTEPAHTLENLERQRRLVRWYCEHAHYLQAITLAREWVVSWRLVHTGERQLMNREARLAVECELGSIHAAGRAGNAASLRLPGVPQSVNVGDLWRRLADLRNDLAHVNDDPTRGGGQIKVVEALIARIEAIVREIECLELPPSAGNRGSTER